MSKKITLSELSGMPEDVAMFAIEYVADFNPRRAAKVTGHDPDSGYSLSKRADVTEFVRLVKSRRFEAADITAEWLLLEAVDNHQLAREQGNVSASNTALNIIAKHTFVDAYAAEKVEVTGESEVMDRLLRGRKRAADASQQSSDADAEPSFL